MVETAPSVRVGLAVFVWKDGKFLVLKRFGAHGTGQWSVPGGHLEFGETLELGARREVMEETGLSITNVQFLALTNDEFKAAGSHYITVWLRSDWVSGEPTILEPTKCTAQTWCDFQSLPQPLFEPVWTNLRIAKPELFNQAHRL